MMVKLSNIHKSVLTSALNAHSEKTGDDLTKLVVDEIKDALDLGMPEIKVPKKRKVKKEKVQVKIEPIKAAPSKKSAAKEKAVTNPFE